MSKDEQPANVKADHGPYHNTFLRTLDSWKVASVYEASI